MLKSCAKLCARRAILVRATVLALFLSLLVVVSLPATAQGLGWNPAVVDEVQRLLGVEREEAASFLAWQAQAFRTHAAAKDLLGESYGGAWLDHDDRSLVVGTTDQSHFEELEALGALPIQTEFSASRLSKISDEILEYIYQSEQLRASVVATKVDYSLNSVVIDIFSDGFSEASALISELPFEQGALVSQKVFERSEFFSTIKAGDAYNNSGTDGYDCTVGFGVTEDSYFPQYEGYLTAAHCGWPNHPVTDLGSQSQGNFEDSDYPPQPEGDPEPGLPTYSKPNEDHAWVETNTNWTPSSSINTYGSGPASVIGSTEAPLKSLVCRYGRTTGGPHCGTITAFDVTLHVNDGRFNMIVINVKLIETSACADNKDSGGPLVFFIDDYHAHAQGTLTAGAPSGCPNNNAKTYFAPVNKALYKFGLKLLTGWVI